eukprot:m.34685 g.34685  ORF g.34685 m.34685 type:complete len:54 (-) comp5248_c0_seq1:168-329(-)
MVSRPAPRAAQHADPRMAPQTAVWWPRPLDLRTARHWQKSHNTDRARDDLRRR